MWKIYDELIAAVPSELRVTDCMVGINWILVRSLTTGIAMTMENGMGAVKDCGSLVGKQVREIAEYVKSWNSLEAGLGLAAINSAINTVARVESLTNKSLDCQEQDNVFNSFRPEIKGKKVAVIGHFPDLERLRDWCTLSVLERNPQPGDIPDPACEYILPGQDYVFITGTTLINKTLPRLLELCKKARVVIVGPSTPLHPVLFKKGADILAGSVVENDKIWTYVQQGGMGQRIFKEGCRMVKIHRPFE
ncbi:DUF364 domain-containing protein [Dehalobacter sp. TBBPA1]|uniref:Rossmann-like domain-containing protein n=1 Tax=Dehalobacter sp. TBBPA1 TaxID=3235037 RepID=UPI0034A3F9A4